MRFTGRYKYNPVFGRLVHKAPSLRIQDVAERNRAFEELTRTYGTEQAVEPRRRYTAFRLSGGEHIPIHLPVQSGGFQHLKVSYIYSFIHTLIFKSKANENVKCYFPKIYFLHITEQNIVTFSHGASVNTTFNNEQNHFILAYLLLLWISSQTFNTCIFN